MTQKFWIYLSALCVVILIFTNNCFIVILWHINNYAFVYLEMFSILREDLSRFDFYDANVVIYCKASLSLIPSEISWK